jgi:hypothetical protein
LLKGFGRQPFPSDQVVAHQQKIKDRDVTIEKNKKLKTAKKPEDPVPVLDNLESKVTKDAEGMEVTNWFLLKNP